MERGPADPFDDWCAALERRHLSRLTFQEVRRGLQALSALYVERRGCLGAGRPAPERIVDLGCGTGAAGAAWSLAAGGGPAVTGVDRNAWAVEEATWNLRVLGVRGQGRRGDLETTPLPGGGEAILLAYAVNELEADPRRRLLERLIAAARRGAQALVVEPIAKRSIPWWSEWS